MEVGNRVAIVTGGGGGIGAAIAGMLVANGANVVVADLNRDAAEKAADAIGADTAGSALGVGADVSDTEQIRGLISLAEKEFGPVEMYFANAGIFGAPGLAATEADWDLSLDVNLRAHVRAAQLLVPGWIDRGEGYFVSTASAAGLLTQIGSATYSVTKHAALGFAEWLSVTYGDRGVRVSCLCPMGVNTTLLHSDQDGDPAGTTAIKAVTSAGEVLEPAQVAAEVLAAITDERFLILPHANVLDMYRQKGSDYERWLRGMRRYQASLLEHGA